MSNDSIKEDWHNPRKSNRAVCEPAECFRDDLPRLGDRSVWAVNASRCSMSPSGRSRVNRLLDEGAPCIIYPNDENTVWFRTCHNVCGFICTCIMCKAMWIDHDNMDLESNSLETCRIEHSDVQGRWKNYAPVCIGHLGAFGGVHGIYTHTFARYKPGNTIYDNNPEDLSAVVKRDTNEIRQRERNYREAQRISREAYANPFEGMVINRPIPAQQRVERLQELLRQQSEPF